MRHDVKTRSRHHALVSKHAVTKFSGPLRHICDRRLLPEALLGFGVYAYCAEPKEASVLEGSRCRVNECLLACEWAPARHALDYRAPWCGLPSPTGCPANSEINKSAIASVVALTPLPGPRPPELCSSPACNLVLAASRKEQPTELLPRRALDGASGFLVSFPPYPPLNAVTELSTFFLDARFTYYKMVYVHQCNGRNPHD